MSNLRILDLFCGGGGISVGWNRMGFSVMGVDIEYQPDYPFCLSKEDALSLDPDWISRNFDVVHASPRCQAFAWGTHDKEKYPNQIPATRELLEKTGLPYVIENVQNAPLRKDLVLCGEMFGLRVIRHRVFEIKGFKCLQLQHQKHKLPVKPSKSYYMQVAGHGGDSFSFKFDDHKQAMGIDWMTKKQTLNESIPPIYASYIASQFLMWRNYN